MPESSAKRPGKRPTLTDVAHTAGVSVALASIVMRDAEGASDKSRERVKRAAAELGYRPDSRARSLRSHRNRTLGVTLYLGEPLHAELADALYAAADEAGYELVLGATGAHRNELRALDTLADAGTEAIIAISSNLSSAALAQVAEQVPVVSMLRQVRDITSILTDEAAGIEALVDHLIQRGHRRLLHLDGGSAVSAAQRRTAFKHTVARTEGRVTGAVLAAGPDETAAFDAMNAYLEHEDAPTRATAVLAFNDRAALGALRAIDQAGLRVPEEMAVTGFDDSEFARLAHVDLTSVRQDVGALATAALAAATTASRDGSEHAPRLVIRGSTTPTTP
ncbi:substrate-binding domain-containing protein [Zhihengliuella halotolerans]|uniref:substrate-binding domain-containing protein n=1 Tax=Zhihengliuella halotolerans TaxID=370736 RepID=UPI00102C24A3